MVQERVSRFPRGTTLRCPVCEKTGTVGQITAHCGKAKGCKGAKPEIAVAVSHPSASEEGAVPAAPSGAPESSDEEWDPDTGGLPWDPPAEEVIDFPRVVEQPRPRTGKPDARDPQRGRMARATTDGQVHADLYLLPTTNALIEIVAEDRENFPFVAEPCNASQVVDAGERVVERLRDPRPVPGKSQLLLLVVIERVDDAAAPDDIRRALDLVLRAAGQVEPELAPVRSLHIGPDRDRAESGR